MIYSHWSEVPEDVWPCQFFKPQEIACKGTGEIVLDLDALRALDAFREKLGRAFSPSSAYRSAYHNARVGGSPLSMHRLGRAFDIPLSVGEKDALHRCAVDCGFSGFGLNYHSFIHIDTGRARAW